MQEKLYPKGKLRKAVDVAAAASILTVALGGTAAAAEKSPEPTGVSILAGPRSIFEQTADKPPLDEIIKEIKTPKKHTVKAGEGFAHTANQKLEQSLDKEGTKSAKVIEMHMLVGLNKPENPNIVANKIWVNSEEKTKVIHTLAAATALPKSTPKEVLKVKKALESLNQQATIDISYDAAVTAQFGNLMDKAEKPGKIRTWLKKFLPKADIAVAAEENIPQQQDQQEKKHLSPTPAESISPITVPPESAFRDDITPTLILGGVAITLLGGAGLIAVSRRRAENRLQRSESSQPVDVVTFPVSATQEEVDDIVQSSLKKSLPEDYAYAMNIWDLAQKNRSEGNSENANNTNIYENYAQIFLTLITKARDERYKPSFGERRLIKEIRHYLERHRHREDDPKLGRKLVKYLNKHAQEV